MVIRRYANTDEANLLRLIRSEGDEWSDYFGSNGMTPRFKTAMQSSIAYIAVDGETVCGFVRARDDDGLGVYIYDLLVDKNHRGKGYGSLMLKQVSRDFPGFDVYVMSDVDGYYEKLGYKREGSIFKVGSVTG